ncbi:hypothetical protein EYF80_034964 [Liparis tanakae]|uniref:Uncharacterized protein n=1 Tax=Liparis tanakae TaxID=230148 RepID=A0A4Z2GNX2_9TELE|nr:hypothetical protein EYF80_034964 [Liparis tanakae]
MVKMKEARMASLCCGQLTWREDMGGSDWWACCLTSSGPGQYDEGGGRGEENSRANNLISLALFSESEAEPALVSL